MGDYFVFLTKCLGATELWRCPVSLLYINPTISCVKAAPYLINRPSFQCETHPRNEKWYVNGCCDVSFCSSNLTLDTSKMFDDKG